MRKTQNESMNLKQDRKSLYYTNNISYSYNIGIIRLFWTYSRQSVYHILVLDDRYILCSYQTCTSYAYFVQSLYFIHICAHFTASTYYTVQPVCLILILCNQYILYTHTLPPKLLIILYFYRYLLHWNVL